MTDWSFLLPIQEILQQYYFGDQITYYAGVLMLFLIIFVSAGLDFRFALIFCLPLAGAFVLAGVFGGSTWILPAMLTLLAMVYAYAVIDLFT